MTTMTTLRSNVGVDTCPCARRSGEFLVIGTDDRRLITRTTEAPFRYICNLEYDGWSWCTGTLIGPRTVLTAGHCLTGVSSPSRMRVIPGRNGPHEPLPATRVTRLIPYPGFAPSTPTDVGLLRLANPIGRTVGWWRRSVVTSRLDPIGSSMSARPLPMPAGSISVNLSGYPRDLPRRGFGCRVPGGGACDESPMGSPGRNRTQCGTRQYATYETTVTGSGGMLWYRNDTCIGHSGSPVWVRRHPSMGGRVLVGVHVHGGATANAAVRLTPTMLRWIEAHTR